MGTLYKYLLQYDIHVHRHLPVSMKNNIILLHVLCIFEPSVTEGANSFL